MIRLFAAIALPSEIVPPLTARQNGLPGARWRPPESLHVTLRFFGEIAENLAEDLDGELAAISAGPFELAFAGVGHFGEGAAIDTVWAGLARSEALEALAKACERAARRCGLRPDTRHYRPHVTLAYLRRPDPTAVAHWIQANNLLRSPSFAVDAFGLFSSWQTGEGSRYRLERHYPLKSAAHPLPGR